MQNLNLSEQKFLLKIQKLNLKMLKLKKPRKYLRKFSWIDAQKKPCKEAKPMFYVPSNDVLSSEASETLILGDEEGGC